MKKTYRKHYHCQYLSAAAQTYIKAIDDFYKIDYDFYTSFSTFHKAWVLLFQSDIILNENGYLFLCTSCKGPDGKRSDPKCNNDAHRFPGRKKYNTKYNLNSSSQHYALEKALNELSDKKSINPKNINILESGYDISKGTGLFKSLNSSNGFYTNLSIFRRIRNEYEHAILEPNIEMASIWQRIALPYVIANAKSFIETYFAMYQIHSEKKHSRASIMHCSCKNVISSEDLRTQMRFPVSYDALFGIENMGRVMVYDQEVWQKLFESQDALGRSESNLTGLQQEAQKQLGQGKFVAKQVQDKILVAKEKIQNQENEWERLYKDVEAHEKGLGKQFNQLRSIISDMWLASPDEETDRVKIPVKIEHNTIHEDALSMRSQEIANASYYLYRNEAEVKKHLASQGYKLKRLEFKKYRNKVDNSGMAFFAFLYGEERYSQMFVDYILNYEENEDEE